MVGLPYCLKNVEVSDNCVRLHIITLFTNVSAILATTIRQFLVFKKCNSGIGNIYIYDVTTWLVCLTAPLSSFQNPVSGFLFRHQCKKQ